MIFQFPIAHDDELLVSILARFISRQGIRDDKVALEMLFGSRNIVPSALLQGHIYKLLSQVGHIWQVDSNEVIQRHSALPFFQSFVEPSRMIDAKTCLMQSDKSHVMKSIGLNASNVIWPKYYRYCPECLAEDHALLAYSYWRRTFQLPGVIVCPEHYCYLQNSSFKLSPSRRHGFSDASELLAQDKVLPIRLEPTGKLSQLSITLKQLLNASTPYVAPVQWSLYYQKLANTSGLRLGGRIDHSRIQAQVKRYWGECFLSQWGLSLNNDNNWLLAFFRKHRRHYSALHHLVCNMALQPDVSFVDVIKEASILPKCAPEKRVYFSSKATERAETYRRSWLTICSQSDVLKDIRATKKGASTYSWLYRFDNAWLQQHLPKKMRNDVGRQVNWKKRDLELVKQLISIRDRSYENLNLPRMTQTWFISTSKVSWGISSHLDNLPLCKDFFIKYSESIEEYQIRRVLAIIVNCIHKDEPIPQAYEIERIAGLSKKRSREPVKHILSMDLDNISCFKLSTRGGRAQKS